MTLQYNNCHLYFETHGQGTPLVLLHGFLENTNMWDGLLPRLTQHHQVITIDLLGHGKTGCLGEVHTMEDMAAAVVRVMAFLQHDAACLVGHSMGGYVALAIAALFPEKVSGLILLNSTAKADSEERMRDRDRAIKVAQQNPNAYTRMAFGHLFGTADKAAFANQIDQLQQEASKTPLPGIIAALAGMKIRKDRTDILQNFGSPKRMIAGKQDPILSFEALKKEAQETGLQFVPMKGGHMLHIENLEGVLAAITSP